MVPAIYCEGSLAGTGRGANVDRTFFFFGLLLVRQPIHPMLSYRSVSAYLNYASMIYMFAVRKPIIVSCIWTQTLMKPIYVRSGLKEDPYAEQRLELLRPIFIL